MGELAESTEARRVIKYINIKAVNQQATCANGQGRRKMSETHLKQGQLTGGVIGPPTAAEACELDLRSKKASRSRTSSDVFSLGTLAIDADAFWL